MSRSPAAMSIASGKTASSSSAHVCSDCGTGHAKWVGRCSGCGAWNTLAPITVADPASARPRGGGPVRLDEVDPGAGLPVPTGIAELDRVLGGGLVPGSVTLLGGEPGVGKSTLVLQLLAGWRGPSLFVSAEESEQQVRLRAERLGAQRSDQWILAEVDLPSIADALDRVQPGIAVVDSIQTISDPATGSPPGSVAQVRACAHALVAEAKRRQLPVVIVGHVTKDGGLAGPRVLEHVVDTVLTFEGDRHHALRLLRSTKHRYGPTGELGLFEMGGLGLTGVPDASGLLLTDRRTGVAGSAVLPTIEGHRPIVVELQALTTPVPPAVPGRRTAHGLDTNRLAMLLAVIERRARIPVAAHDVYASVVGGVRVAEPGLDLALALALVSSVVDRPLPADLVAFGEIGLAGELRQAPHSTRRLSEAARLGFARAIVPASSPEPEGSPIRTVRVASLAEALAAAHLSGAAERSGDTPLRAV